MYYDTQVIYRDTRSNKNSFQLNGFTYYTTKTGILKKKSVNEKDNKAIKITHEEYRKAWDKYDFLFN